MTSSGKWALSLFVALHAAFAAMADEVSYIRVDVPKLLASRLAMEALSAWPGGAPVLERFQSYMNTLGVDPAKVAPVVTIIPDFDAADRTVALLRFPPGAQEILAAAAEKTVFFSVSSGTSGKIFCLTSRDDKSPGAKSLRFVAVFVSPRLAWAGEESAVEEWRSRTAGGPGQFFPDLLEEREEAVIFSLPVAGRDDVRRLFGGVEKIDGKLLVKANSLELAVRASGGDIQRFSSVVQGFYILGVNLLFDRDTEIKKTLYGKPVFKVENNIFTAHIELERPLIERMVTLLRAKELPAPAGTSPEDEVTE
ncbi:MAG: hypothetical protein AB7F40_00520 [Victivallaceae bacterium]|nr:hypothetical protein [Victivallaceae bacterium]